MSQSWFVQNHIRTVHAIAICNLIEITMAIVTEASLPSHLRWLPVGMDVNYLKKATGKLEATSTIDPAAHFKLAAYPGEVKIPIEVKNRSGELVTKAEVSSVARLLSLCHLINGISFLIYLLNKWYLLFADSYLGI